LQVAPKTYIGQDKPISQLDEDEFEELMSQVLPTSVAHIVFSFLENADLDYAADATLPAPPAWAITFPASPPKRGFRHDSHLGLR